MVTFVPYIIQKFVLLYQNYQLSFLHGKYHWIRGGGFLASQENAEPILIAYATHICRKAETASGQAPQLDLCHSSITIVIMSATLLLVILLMLLSSAMFGKFFSFFHVMSSWQHGVK
jgi:hypothetical protein